MAFTLSTNIKLTNFNDINYIVTSNAQKTAGSIIADYNSGIHSFTLIGTYGTGKSSFLLALEDDLLNKSGRLIVSKGQFNGYTKFQCLNIVGEFSTLPVLLGREFGKESASEQDVIDLLDAYIKECKKKKVFLVIAIDEFGKVLEHAAKVNPEKEIYFLQQLSEFVNSPARGNVILLATLHQNMNAYASKLPIEQKEEWNKVKGRFQEIVFSEPEEQLLSVAAEQIGKNPRHIVNLDGLLNLFTLAKKSKFIGNDALLNVAKRIYPMDIFSGVLITRAIQRYGQNERSLFQFLTSTDENSVIRFEASEHLLYNMANVYDYITYSFYSYLSEVNSDSANWRASKTAIERVEGLFSPAKVERCVKLVKAISLMNIFCPAIVMDRDMLSRYAELAMDIPRAGELIDELCLQNVIRFAKYKSQYIIFEGSDVNIEDEMFKAVGQVARPANYVQELSKYLEKKVVLAHASYYKTGTPRYSAYEISDHALDFDISGDIDGFINLVFAENEKERKAVLEASKSSNKAIIYVFYNKTKEIVDHLYEIAKLQYVKDHVVINDRVAEREVDNLINYEKNIINGIINNSLLSYSSDIQWFYHGTQFTINSQFDLNRLLSQVSDDVYSSTPIIKNELFNRQKVANSAVALARVTLHNTMLDLEAEEKENLGFSDDKFPPEKTIYYTLLKETGIHAKRNGVWSFGSPDKDSIRDLWDACEDFLRSTTEKQRKLGELVKILQSAPFKLKQGFIEMWLPIYLIVKRQEYSLYSDAGVYVPTITREVLDLLQKNPNNFKVKAFSMDGVKLDFFNQYRQFLRKDDQDRITGSSFIETVKPFLAFYRSLNEYARTTQNFDNYNVVKFREVLANAKDPEKTFFEDMPAAFGFKNDTLSANAEFMAQYKDMIKRATHELSGCYSKLVDSIEKQFVKILGIHSDKYEEYKEVVEKRFGMVKDSYLSIKQKSFLKGLLRKEGDKIRWYESICYVALEKPLASIKDHELPMLIENLKSLVRALDKFVDISKAANKKVDADVFNFEMVSTKGMVKAQSIVLPDSQKKQTDDLEKKISALLTGDSNVDVCALLNILQEKLNKK